MQELGLDTSRRKKDEIPDQHDKGGDGLKAGLKRRRWTRDASDSKRRKVMAATQESAAERDTKLVDGAARHSTNNESLLITGTDTR